MFNIVDFDLILILISCIMINIPFGMLRAKTKKFSIQWILCIHAPIPISAVFRRVAGYGWGYLPLFLLFSIIGQAIGQFVMSKYIDINNAENSD